MGNTQILNQMAGIEKRRVPRDCCYILCTCFEERHCLKKVCPCGLCDISKCKCEACGVRLSSTSPSFSHERLQANIDSAFARTESNSTSPSSCSISSIEQPSKPVYKNSYFETCDHPVTPAAIEMGPPKVMELMSSQSSTYSCCARCSKCAKKRRSRTCSQGCGALYDTSQSETINHGRDRTLSSVERQQTTEVTTHSERSPSSFSQVSSKSVSERKPLESSDAVILDKSTQCRPETNDLGTQTLANKECRPETNDLQTQTLANKECRPETNDLHTQTLANKQDRNQQTVGSQSDCKCTYSSSQRAESKTPSSASKTFTSSTSSKAIQSDSCSADIERNQKLNEQESLLKKQQSAFRSSRSKTSTSSTATPIDSDSDSYGRVQMLVNMDCDSELESKPVPSPTCSPRSPEPLQLSIRLRSKSEQKKSRSSRSGKSLDEEIFQVRRRQLEHGMYSGCYRNEYYRQYAH